LCVAGARRNLPGGHITEPASIVQAHPQSPFLRRRRQLARRLTPAGLDALLVSHPVNVTYLTGFGGEASYLIVGRKRTLMASDGRFTTQLAEECPGLAVHIRPPSQTTVPEVAKVLTDLGFRKVAFESSHLTVADCEWLKSLAPTIDWAPTKGWVESLRAVKDAGEVAQVKAAIGIAERAFTAFKASLGPDDTEKQLADRMEQLVRQVGGTGTSFPTIVGVGPRSGLPHAPLTDARVASSDFLLVDWGACGRFYKSDLTRMIVTRRSWFRPAPVRPPRDDLKFAKVFGTVVAAQAKAIAAIRPGAKARDVDAAARTVIADAGYGTAFSHGLGHGLGLQVHEAPFMRASSDDVLAAGMVVTVEPGIYLEGWGGVRIEDDVLVTPDGREVLTTLPRDLAAAELV
jgi:Xaa-Pro aminopeptidase